MQLEHVELLKIAREIHDLPRGMERFQEYLRTMKNGLEDDVDLVPLIAMNPMGREHVAARLDELLALDAESIARDALKEAEPLYEGITVDFDVLRHGFTILDDVRGGWTNRIVNDASIRFGTDAVFKRPWIVSHWLVSETPTAEGIRQRVKCAAARIAHTLRHGAPKTLGDFMTQEGWAEAYAGVERSLDKDDLEYTRHVLAPHRDNSSYPVIIAAVYGDAAARELGYPPVGVSENAGFALALSETVGTINPASL
jgi:hypothetical protein